MMLQAVHVGTLREALQVWGPTDSFFRPVGSTTGVSFDPVLTARAHQSSLHAVRASCPYLRHKIQPGDVLHALVGPDRAERYCHSTAGVLVLPKDRTFAGGATTLLALGLPLALHAVCAASVPCTLQQDPTLPDDLQFWVNMSSFSEDKLGNDSLKKILDELFLCTWTFWSSLTCCDFVVGCGVVIMFLLPLWLWLRNISHFVLEIWKLRSDDVDKRNIDRNHRESDTAEQTVFPSKVEGARKRRQ